MPEEELHKARELAKGRMLLRMEDTRAVSGWLGGQEILSGEIQSPEEVIARLEAGTCWINHYNVTPIELPFGGVKLSGLGRENGRAAMEHYTQLKSVYVAKGDMDAPY